MRRWLYISAVMWMLAGSLPVGCMLTGCKGACGSMGTCGCSCRHACGGLADAQRTLAVADSLRLNAGAAYDDSLALAEAYEVFGRYRLVCPDDYARTCYYYGRLLRNRGHQVGAMQAFIRGTHAPYIQRLIPLPWFSDYHILGRIYSNIGTMCHQADEYELAYNMNNKSAECFRRIGDSTAYYYGLNAMALQLAEQRRHTETLVLLSKIEADCSIPDVLTKTLETKAFLYDNLSLYDSAICLSRELYKRGYAYPTGYVVEARAYWAQERYDSAVYYANLVMNNPYAGNKDKFNMLYILAYCDSSIEKDELKKRAEERADIDKENLDPLHHQLTQALDILTDDLNEKTLIRHVFLFVSLFILAPVVIAVAHKRTRHERSKQQYLQNQQKVLLKQNADMRNDTIQLKQQYTEHQKKITQEIEATCKALRSTDSWQSELHWKDYKTLSETANKLFFLLVDKLNVNYRLSEKEIRLCLLVLLGKFTNDEQADYIIYSRSGIGRFKNRLSQKLNIETKDLRRFLIEMATSGDKNAINK